MADGTPTPTGSLVTPELLQTVAEAVGAALSKPQVGQGQAVSKQAPARTGEALGTALAPLAAPVLARAESKLKSRKLWTALGAIAVLAAQNPLGLALPPVAQLGIAAVAAIYVAAQAIVDGTRKGGGKS